MKMFLEAIEKALPLVKWEKVTGPRLAPGNMPKAVFYQGMADGWTFTVASFDIEDQGFPPGSRGYDGAAASGKAIVRLTRELAEKAVKLVEAQHDGRA